MWLGHLSLDIASASLDSCDQSQLTISCFRKWIITHHSLWKTFMLKFASLSQECMTVSVHVRNQHRTAYILETAFRLMSGDFGDYMASITRDGVHQNADRDTTGGPSGSTLSRARYKMDAFLMGLRRYQWNTWREQGNEQVLSISALPGLALFDSFCIFVPNGLGLETELSSFLWWWWWWCYLGVFWQDIQCHWVLAVACSVLAVCIFMRASGLC